jgi:hypothetical protein
MVVSKATTGLLLDMASFTSADILKWLSSLRLDGRSLSGGREGHEALGSVEYPRFDDIEEDKVVDELPVRWEYFDNGASCARMVGIRTISVRLSRIMAIEFTRRCLDLVFYNLEDFIAMNQSKNNRP